MLKTAIITGAGHVPGIGSQTAIDLLDKNTNVAIISRSIDNFWYDLQKQKPDNLCLFEGDITNAKVQHNFLDIVISKFGRLDFLVNNASSGKPEIDGNGLISKNTWIENFDINVITVYNFAYLCKPYLESNKGSIVNISSRAAIMNNVGNNVAYSVSKAALLKLTEQMAIDLSPNITVNAVCPGFIDTARLHKVFGDRYEDIKITRQAANLTKENITVYDVSNAIIMLLFNRAINGQILSVCAGSSLSINTIL